MDTSTQTVNSLERSAEPKVGTSSWPETRPLSDLTRRNVEIIAQLEKEVYQRKNRTELLAQAIGTFVGSMPFVYIHLAWFAFWIGWNHLLPASYRFDAYPFTLLSFMVSLEAVFLSTFILIARNHQEELARRRNHLDLQINLLSEQENSQIMKMLAAIQRQLQMQCDPHVESLTEATEPIELVSQIDEFIDNNHRPLAESK